MKPEIKLLDLTSNKDQEEYVKCLEDNYAIVPGGTFINSDYIHVTLVKIPEKKIVTPKAK